MRACVILMLYLCSACLTYTNERHTTFEPVDDEGLAQLEIGTSGIGDALANLGAPLYVWEGVDDAIVLAYGSEHRSEWGLSVSVPVFDQASASFNYDDAESRLAGYILVFDRELRLQILRAGLLRDLGQSVRLRPAPAE